MMKKVEFKKIGIAISAGILLAGMTACGSSQETAQESAPAKVTASPAPETAKNDPAGTLLLSINPEIEISYDREGDVLTLEGLNTDGKSVLTSYSGYEGKPCRDVVGELVMEINEAGFFDETIAGQEKNIILKLAKGSVYPDDEFLNGIAEEIRITVETNQIGSRTVALDDDDYDDAFGEKGYIDAQAAQEIISAQTGRDDLQFIVKEYELDDGIYEIEFIMDGAEYEYEVDAVTGKVYEIEKDDPAETPAPVTQSPAAATPAPSVHPDTDDDDRDDGYDDDGWDDDYDDNWDDNYDDTWDDDYDDSWDDNYDDTWDDDYDDSWDDDYDDTWDDDYDDSWDDDYDDTWDDDYDDSWDDDYDDSWDDDYDDTWDDDYDDSWDDDDDDWDDDDDDDWDDDDDDDWDNDDDD
jgi:hypothetical protein